jgi:sarcosine oxidase subunit beta
LATACYLAREGATDVVILERGHIGDGSTPRAVGMIRQQFANLLGVRLASQTLEIYRTFHAETGVGRW